MTAPRKTKAKALVPEAPKESADLFDRIVAILEEARKRVVHAVNSTMVTSYWHIGREIVQELQGGDPRAKYGQNLLAELSARLTQRYGEGFSATNLRYMRQFYQV